MVRRDRSLLLSLLVGLLLAMGVVAGDRVLTKVSQEQVVCQQINQRVLAPIDNILNNGLRALPHSPYFKGHPELLAAAEKQYQDDINKLAPLKCG